MNRLDQPGGIMEGSPGVLYFESGASSTAAVLSVTTEGSKTVIASFPSGNNFASSPVSGANGRFYSDVDFNNDPATIFSVSAVPGSKHLYAPQNLDSILTQNLPGGNFLAESAALSGSPYNIATVDLTGTVTPIYQFPATDLTNSAIRASDGNYYGVVAMRSASTGYVFRLTTFRAGVSTALMAVR